MPEAGYPHRHTWKHEPVTLTVTDPAGAGERSGSGQEPQRPEALGGKMLAKAQFSELPEARSACKY